MDNHKFREADIRLDDSQHARHLGDPNLSRWNIQARIYGQADFTVGGVSVRGGVGPVPHRPQDRFSVHPNVSLASSSALAAEAF
jgi:hypothetical protein